MFYISLTIIQGSLESAETNSFLKISGYQKIIKSIFSLRHKITNVESRHKVEKKSSRIFYFEEWMLIEYFCFQKWLIRVDFILTAGQNVKIKSGIAQPLPCLVPGLLGQTHYRPTPAEQKPFPADLRHDSMKKNITDTSSYKNPLSLQTVI